jgi:hypothetical protein
MNWPHQLNQWLADNPWFAIVASVASLISIPLAFVLFVRGKRERKPCYAFRSFNLIRGVAKKIPEIQISYSGHGEPIEQFTITRLVFWNDGRETINKQDIAKGEPLEIIGKEGVKILNANVISEKNPANQFECSLSRDKSTLRIGFDFLDHGEGAILQIFHTGNTGSDLELKGIIKGAGNPKRFNYPRGYPLGLKLMVLSGAIVTLALLLASYFLPASSVEQKNPIRWPLVIMFLMYVPLNLYVFRKKHPRNFRMFSQEFFD